MGDHPDSPEELLAPVFGKFSNQSSRRTGSDKHSIGLTQWLRLLKEASVLAKSRADPHPQTGITHTDAEMLLLRTAGRGAKTLRFDQFCTALRTVARWMFDQSEPEEAYLSLAKELLQLAGGAPTRSQTNATSLEREQAILFFGDAAKALKPIYELYAVRGLPRDKLLDRRSFGAFLHEYAIIPMLSEAAAAELFVQCADSKGGTQSFGAFMQCLTLVGKLMFGESAEQPRTLLEHLGGTDACEQLQRDLRGSPRAHTAVTQLRRLHLREPTRAPAVASGVQPVGGEAAEMLDKDELAAVTKLFKKYTDIDGRFNIGGLGRLARDAKLVDETVCGQQLTMADLDRAFGIEASRGGGAVGYISNVDQLSRVLLHIAIIKFPDASDEESAVGYLLRAHVLPFALPKAADEPPDPLDGFFDEDVVALVDLVSDELQALYKLSCKGPHGMGQSQWLQFVRKFGLMPMGTQRELRAIYEARRVEQGAEKIDFEGFVNALCSLAVLSASKSEDTAAGTGERKIRHLICTIESSSSFEHSGIRPAASQAAAKSRGSTKAAQPAARSRPALTPSWH